MKIYPLKGLNIIGPILHSFSHNASTYLAIWTNTVSMSAKVLKFTKTDPSQAKQSDMISSVVSNNQSKYEMILEKLREGKNNDVNWIQLV
ncbi:hypothetical protein F8M41_018675 [Gigaspora margarita]|uniref:Uncharacterized protein n=1 Tax=Gigaspora margarita TaxID=4874 RepID=A0A8H4B2I1_GIGMA|nr:hypothetical protein F8M41_018675 [Gigaspora margarita]